MCFIMYHVTILSLCNECFTILLFQGYVSMAYDAVNRKIGQYEYITMGGESQRKLGALLDYNSVSNL